jgi:hypothetical protein
LTFSNFPRAWCPELDAPSLVPRAWCPELGARGLFPEVYSLAKARTRNVRMRGLRCSCWCRTPQNQANKAHMGSPKARFVPAPPDSNVPGSLRNFVSGRQRWHVCCPRDTPTVVRSPRPPEACSAVHAEEIDALEYRPSAAGSTAATAGSRLRRRAAGSRAGCERRELRG